MGTNPWVLAGLASGLVLFDTASMAVLKNYTVHNDWALLMAAILLQGIAWVFLIKGIRSSGLVVINGLWDTMSFLAIGLIGLLIFHEKLSKKQWIGLIFAAIAVLLLAL
jgi:multidrug transporter EmrE-like cation transporter